MFKNTGKKIKLFAQIFFPLDIVCFVVWAIVLFANAIHAPIFILYGFFSLIFGPIVAWFSALLLYSWGSMVDNVQSIKNKQCQDTTEDPSLWQLLSKKLSKEDAQDQTKKRQKLEDQLSSGKITFDEYNKAIDKK